MSNAALLDTSFFIRLMKENDSLHNRAKEYFKYLLENNFELFISTISIAEYCVVGNLNELPLRNLKIIPFNIKHAEKAGEFTRYIHSKRDTISELPRVIIPNDSKLFAQAETEKNINFYITSDLRSNKIYSKLQENLQLHFQFVSISDSLNETFRYLIIPPQ